MHCLHFRELEGFSFLAKPDLLPGEALSPLHLALLAVQRICGSRGAALDTTLSTRLNCVSDDRMSGFPSVGGTNLWRAFLVTNITVTK